MISKKQCKNDPSYTFTGKESSPLGLGFSASAEKVGSRMTGRDQTMWMVGIKNGVNVWNRIPTEIAAAAEPLQKDDHVMGDDVKVEVKPAVVPITKKKTVAKKKVAQEKQVVEEPKNEDAKELENVADDDNAKKENTKEEKEDKPKAKKRVVKKKVVQEAVVKDDDTSSEVSESKEEEKKPKKKPTTFNIFMSYRVKQLTEEEPTMSHKEKFGKAAAEWGVMDADAKKEAVEKAMEGRSNA